MEINMKDVAEVVQAQYRLLAAEMLNLRQGVCAATGFPESAVAFVVPPDVLIGVTEVGGSPVIRSADVQRPGIVLPLPEISAF